MGISAGISFLFANFNLVKTYLMYAGKLYDIVDTAIESLEKALPEDGMGSEKMRRFKTIMKQVVRTMDIAEDKVELFIDTFLSPMAGDMVAEKNDPNNSDNNWET